MLIRFILLAGLSILLTACATNSYHDLSQDSTTRKGVRYLLGRGVAQDDEKAFYYFKEAAERENDAFAQNELAYLYAAGKGTKRNDKKAFFWYQKAAERGLVSAEYNVGLMYLYGIGRAPDKTMGMRWIKKSAAQGFLPAKRTLAKP